MTESFPPIPIESNDQIITFEDIQEEEKLSQWQKMKYAGQIGILGAVVLPINEAARLTPTLAAYALTGNSIVSAAVLGVSTLAVEGIGARSTASLIDTRYGGKVFDWLSVKTEKVLKGRKMSAPVEALVGYFGGSAVVLAAKQAEDPSRTLEQNRKHGDLTSSWLSAVVALQWAAGGNAIQDPSMLSIGAALASTVGAYGGVRFAQSRNDKDNGKERI